MSFRPVRIAMLARCSRIAQRWAASAFPPGCLRVFTASAKVTSGSGSGIPWSFFRDSSSRSSGVGFRASFRSYLFPHSPLSSTSVKPSAYFISIQPHMAQTSGWAGGALASMSTGLVSSLP